MKTLAFSIISASLLELIGLCGARLPRFCKRLFPGRREKNLLIVDYLEKVFDRSRLVHSFGNQENTENVFFDRIRDGEAWKRHVRALF